MKTNFFFTEFILLLRIKSARMQIITSFLVSLVCSLNITINEFFAQFFMNNYLLVYGFEGLFITGFLSTHGSYMFSWHAHYGDFICLNSHSSINRLIQMHCFYIVGTIIFLLSFLPMIILFQTYIETIALLIFTSTISFSFFAYFQAKEKSAPLLSNDKEFVVPKFNSAKAYLASIVLIPIVILGIGHLLNSVTLLALIIIISSLSIHIFWGAFLYKRIDSIIQTNKYLNRTVIRQTKDL